MKYFIKLILINMFITMNIYSQECIGNNYEQKVTLSKTIIEDVSISGYKSSLLSNEMMTLTQNVDTINSYDDSSVFYYICTNIGTLRMVENSLNYKSVEYIAPYVLSDKEAKIEFKVGDGYGHSHYKYITLKVKSTENSTIPIERTIDEELENQDISTILNTSYRTTDNKFKIAWQSHQGVDKLAIEYSYDNNSWNTILTETLGSIKSSAREDVVIPSSKDHNKIYFRVQSTNVLDDISVMSQTYILTYEALKPYVQKGTEIPLPPQFLTTGGTETSNTDIDLLWQKVIDSKFNDNVNFYEVSYANNPSFTDATIVNAGNNVAGLNLYERASYIVTDLKDGNKYYFRVRAVNNLGTSGWSNIDSIVVNIPDNPTTPTLTLPVDGATGVSKIPEFRFNSSDADNDELEFYISVGESPNTLYNESGWISTHSQGTQIISYSDFISANPLKPNTVYYWKVLVREQGRDKEYYGGEYLSSSLFSFTTQAVGSDLAIVSAELLSEIKPNKEAIYKLVVKNIGTEKARDELIQAYYKKDSTIFEFWSGSARMQQQLEAGESEEITVKVKFRDDIWTSLNNEIYDNVLVDGNSSIIFDMPLLSSQDIDISNNIKEVLINYNGKLPFFETFWLYTQLTYNEDQDKVHGIIGKPLQIGLGIRDDTKVSKAIIEYRLHSNDTWKSITTVTNSDEFLQSDFFWDIPNDKNFISDYVQVRVKAYEANEIDFSELISIKFPIYSNVLEMKNITFDNQSYTVGDTIFLSYDLLNDYNIKSLDIVLKNSQNKRVHLLNQNFTSLNQLENSLKLIIPEDNYYTGDDFYLEIEMWDVSGNQFNMNSNTFSINSKVTLPTAFTNFIDVYKPLNSNFPTGITGSSYNIIEKLITDDNNVVHMVVASIAQYTEVSNKYNIDYYYVTYSYDTEELSTPIIITSINGDNIDNFEDFTIFDGKPFILFGENNLEGSSSKYYLTSKNGANFTSLSQIVSKSSIKYNEMKFFTFNNKLYTNWLDSEGSTSSNDRRNRVKEVYPNLGVSSVLDNSYLGYYTRIEDNYLYVYCGKIYDLSENLKINSLIFESINRSCTRGGEFKNFSSLNNIINFSSNYPEGIELIKNDFTSSILSDTIGYQANKVAIFDDKIVIIGAKSAKNGIFVYDKNMNKLSETSVGNYADGDLNFYKVDINKNKILAISSLVNKKAYITLADLSNDIISPNILLSNTETTLEVDESITLNWTATDNNNELIKFDIFKIVNGEEILLDTIVDTNIKSFTYTQTDNTEKLIQFKVVAYDNSGNSSYDVLPLRIVNNINITSFTLDKTEINLGDSIIFNWLSNGDETTQFTVSYKLINETQWSKLFTSTGNSKNFIVKDFVGAVEFKIEAGTTSFISDTPLTVNGELLNFKEDEFTPQGEYLKVSNKIVFKWIDTLTTNVVYDIWLRKFGENDFTNIGSTSDKFFEYFADINTSFNWKVSAKFGEAIKESNVISVNVEKLESPSISDINFTLVDNQPAINLSFSKSDGVTYLLVKEYDNSYEEIALGSLNHYTDKELYYGIKYAYSIIAVKDGVKAEKGESRDILASLNEQYEVIIDTINNQVLNSNNLRIEYHPNKEIQYEKYEIWLGTDANNLILYDITDERRYEFTHLKYATNYFINIYPIDYNGNRISSLPSKMDFTTGFDNRIINETPLLTIDEVSTNYVKISWLEIANADEYKVCKRTGSNRFNCFAITKDLSFVDQVVNVATTYEYKLMAVNGFDYTISEGVVIKTKEIDTRTSNVTLKNPPNWKSPIILTPKEINCTYENCLSPNKFSTLDEMYINFIIENNGEKALNTFSYRGTLDNMEQIGNTIGLETNETIDYFGESSIYLGYLSAGEHTLTIELDVDEEIIEDNEFDNFYEISFLVESEEDIYSSTGDFNDNGVADILFRNSATGKNLIYMQNADGTRESFTYTSPISSSWEAVGVGKFNDDGIADILLRHQTTGKNLIFMQSADGSRESFAYTSPISNSWEVKGIADFNGDGVDDILFRHNTNGQALIFFQNEDGSRESFAYTRYLSNIWELVGVGHFDNDNIADILFRDASSGKNLIFFQNADGTRKRYAYTSSISNSWSVEGVADFNKDGIDDILFRDASSGKNLIFFQKSDGTRESFAYTSPISNSWSVAQVADFDGDGIADILFRNITNGKNLIYFENTNGSRREFKYTSPISNVWKVVK